MNHNRSVKGKWKMYELKLKIRVSSESKITIGKDNIVALLNNNKLTNCRLKLHHCSEVNELNGAPVFFKDAFFQIKKQ